MIRINKETCIGCGRCACDCFPGAITVMEKAELSNPAACIGCGHCVAICPVSAVSYDGLPADDIIPSEKDVPPEKMLGLMRSRRSCRHFKATSLPDETLNSLLQAARACPTAKNLQATRYITVRERIPELLDLAGLGRSRARQRPIRLKSDGRKTSSAGGSSAGLTRILIRCFSTRRSFSSLFLQRIPYATRLRLPPIRN